MEPVISLSCSQEPSTGPYPEPDQSSPYHPIPSLLRFILILFCHLHLGLPSGPFPFGFPTKILYAFLFSSTRAIYRAYLNWVSITESQKFCEVTAERFLGCDVVRWMGVDSSEDSSASFFRLTRVERLGFLGTKGFEPLDVLFVRMIFEVFMPMNMQDLRVFTLKMEAVGFSETLIPIYRVTCCHISEYSNAHVIFEVI
jgi:hypothetical protein